MHCRPGAWLEPGMHINAAGSNRANAAELDVAAVARAAREKLTSSIG